MATGREIIKDLKHLAHRMFINGGGDVYLYGSRARGDATPNSDWDILIIIEDGLSSADDFLSFAFPYAEIGWKYGQQVTPIHFTRSQWNAQKNTSFYHNVLSDYIHL